MELDQDEDYAEYQYQQQQEQQQEQEQEYTQEQVSSLIELQKTDQIKPRLKKPFKPNTQIGTKIQKEYPGFNKNASFLSQILSFDKKITKTAVCTSLFKGKTKIYKCYDCQKHQNACICQNCFKASNHEGHRFYAYQTKSEKQFSGVCDCGNSQIWKKSGFCCNHTGVVEYVQISIEQQKKFNQIWRDIFGICFYLIQNQEINRGVALKQQINFLLNQLITNSVYYQQLTAELLNQKDLLDETKTIFESIISTYLKFFTTEDLNLCINLYALTRYTKRFTRSIINCHNQTPSCLDNSKYSQFLFQTLNKIEQFEQLAKEQDITLFLERINPKYVYNVRIMLRFEEHPPIEVVKCLIRKNLIKNSLVKIIRSDRYYNQPPRLAQAILKTLKKCNQKQYLGRAIKQILQNGKQQSSIKIFTMGLVLYEFLTSDFQTTNYRQLFKEIQVEDSLLKAYLFQNIERKVDMILRGESFDEQFTILFKVLDSFQWLDQYFQELMKKYWQMNQTLIGKKDCDIIIHNAVFIISNLVFFCRRQQTELLLYDNYQLKSAKILQRCKESLKISFSQVGLQKISQNAMQKTILNIGKQYKNQLITFVKQNLKYDPKGQFYTYMGQKMQAHPYQPFEHYKYFDKVEFLSRRDYQLITKIFTPTRISQFLVYFGKLQELKNKSNKKNLQLALKISIEAFIVLHCFIGDSLPQLQNLLTKIRNEQINIFEVAQDTNKSLIQVLKQSLCMHKHQASVDEQKKLSFKEKAANMKNKKFEQLRKKQMKAKQLTKQLQQEIQSPVKQYKEVCLLCHQEESDQNSLVCFINISKSNVLSYCFGSNTPQIDIQGCQHRVHQSCFLKSFGNSQYFLCPLCKGVFNCVLPSRLDEQNTKKDTFWIKRIEFFIELTFQSNIKTIFQLFLRFLVYSKAMKSFIDMNEFKQKQKKRLQNIAFSILKYIFQSSSQTQKVDHLNKIANIRFQFQKDASKSEAKYLLKTFILDTIMFELYQLPNSIEAQLQSLLKLSQLIRPAHIRKIINQISPQILQHQSFKKMLTRVNHFQIQKMIPQNFQIKIKCHNLPLTVEEYTKKCQLKCQKCQDYFINVWHCLICGIVRCQNCQKIANHTKKEHFGNCIFLRRQNAEYLLMYYDNLVKNMGAYQNQLNEFWKRSQKSQGYTVKDSSMNEFHKSLILNEVPSMVSRDKLVMLLNREDEVW